MKTLKYQIIVFVRDKNYFDDLHSISDVLNRDVGFPFQVKYFDFLQFLPMRLELDKGVR
jgi:hypothetical protein